MVHNEGAGHLTPGAVLADGGWNENYARVLLIEEYRGQAIVLVDGNGDGAELELEYWSRGGEGGWAGGASSGHSSLDALGRVEAWTTDMHVAALGKAAPGSTISLSYSGITYLRQANEFGIWGFIAPVDPDFPEELPVVAP
jgi:hypothetical protein